MANTKKEGPHVRMESTTSAVRRLGLETLSFARSCQLKINAFIDGVIGPEFDPTKNFAYHAQDVVRQVGDVYRAVHGGATLEIAEPQLLPTLRFFENYSAQTRNREITLGFLKELDGALFDAAIAAKNDPALSQLYINVLLDAHTRGFAGALDAMTKQDGVKKRKAKDQAKKDLINAYSGERAEGGLGGILGDFNAASIEKPQRICNGLVWKTRGQQMLAQEVNMFGFQKLVQDASKTGPEHRDPKMQVLRKVGVAASDWILKTQGTLESYLGLMGFLDFYDTVSLIETLHVMDPVALDKAYKALQYNTDDRVGDVDPRLNIFQTGKFHERNLPGDFLRLQSGVQAVTAIRDIFGKATQQFQAKDPEPRQKTGEIVGDAIRNFDELKLYYPVKGGRKTYAINGGMTLAEMGNYSQAPQGLKDDEPLGLYSTIKDLKAAYFTKIAGEIDQDLVSAPGVAAFKLVYLSRALLPTREADPRFENVREHLFRTLIQVALHPNEYPADSRAIVDFVLRSTIPHYTSGQIEAFVKNLLIQATAEKFDTCGGAVYEVCAALALKKNELDSILPSKPDGAKVAIGKVTEEVKGLLPDRFAQGQAIVPLLLSDAAQLPKTTLYTGIPSGARVSLPTAALLVERQVKPDSEGALGEQDPLFIGLKSQIGKELLAKTIGALPVTTYPLLGAIQERAKAVEAQINTEVDGILKELTVRLVPDYDQANPLQLSVNSKSQLSAGEVEDKAIPALTENGVEPALQMAEAVGKFLCPNETKPVPLLKTGAGETNAPLMDGLAKMLATAQSMREESGQLGVIRARNQLLEVVYEELLSEKATHANLLAEQERLTQLINGIRARRVEVLAGYGEIEIDRIVGILDKMREIYTIVDQGRVAGIKSMATRTATKMASMRGDVAVLDQLFGPDGEMTQQVGQIAAHLFRVTGRTVSPKEFGFTEELITKSA